MNTLPDRTASSQKSRNLNEHTAPRPQQRYTAPNVYTQPSISHIPPTPSASVFAEGQQAATSGAFTSNYPPLSQSPDLLHPASQRARSTSLGQSATISSTQDLKRSHSLNDSMSNPQTYYPQMASPMSGYAQPQIYGQGAMTQSSYYPGIQPSSVPLSSSYMEASRQVPVDYYNSPMPYSQSSYSGNYATSYAGNSDSLMAQSYGSPMAQQYPRPAQPAPLAGAPVQVVDRAKKPQCWEHGCNGREFSTFSNLLRHQREKSGTAAKSYCPHCGAEFTRTTARNGHMEHGKCKTRRATGSQSSS